MKEKIQLPRTGMLATVRNRRGLLTKVEPFDAGAEGRLHLVEIEYTDPDGVEGEQLLWEREQSRQLLEPHALPNVEGEARMAPPDFDALVRAARWNSLQPFLNPADPDRRSEIPISAPFFGAIQVDDFQLVPLLKALQMPRVSLLLADDVGLGKTIEAGLVLKELLIRRRIRRVLIACPAALRTQWQQEMEEKFSLPFDVVDRETTHDLRKRLGLDANPWRTFPRIITSYHYLRQPDVLEEFLSTCREPTSPAEASAELPWDLLIVDEAHNLMPANFGDDSDLSKTLAEISPWFEHRLFLTATPHNGHTRCFSGLLELLDPVRFTRTSDFTSEEKGRIGEVVIRRLKREINELDDRSGRPRRFAERDLEPIPLDQGPGEEDLSRAFSAFRSTLKRRIASGRHRDEGAGRFAVEILNKRLLSCPVAFADSWLRIKRGLEEGDASAGEVEAAGRAAQEDLDDDREKEGREGHASQMVGAWLRPFSDELHEEMAAVDSALSSLGLMARENDKWWPTEDARLSALVDLVEDRLRESGSWKVDERLILFTEYKTTLDYLNQRLQEAYPDAPEGTIRVLFGGMPQHQRDEIRRAFNDPQDPVRLLLATDAASEGLNLQETARLLLHYEIPWNPSRLEQRNGRIDRHGQARDVVVFHFTSEDDADLKFMGHVVAKVHDIREDLGSMGEVFDAAFQRRFQDLEESQRVEAQLEHDMGVATGRAEVPRDAEPPTGVAEARRIEDLREEADLSPETLRDTLDVAMGVGHGRPRLEGPDGRGRMRLKTPIPPSWQGIIDDTVRLGSSHALPGLTFDPDFMIQHIAGRPVYRAIPDTLLLHLGHPVFRHALSTLARARFPGAAEEWGASRWTVRRGDVPEGADGVVHLHVEELAVNELREPIHQWVRTLRIPVTDGGLGHTLAHEAPVCDEPRPISRTGDTEVQVGRDLWSRISLEVRDLLRAHEARLTEAVEREVEVERERAIQDAKERFRSRRQEVQQAIRATTLERLEREREDLLRALDQFQLFPEELRRRQAELQDLEEELQRRRGHYQDLLVRLEREQDRVISRTLPQRYRLHGTVQVFPVGIEIRLPEGAS